MRNSINKNGITKPRNTTTDILIKYRKSENQNHKQNSLLLSNKRIWNSCDKLRSIINIFRELSKKLNNS